jgi:transglutaminase-like putative cysteine protease
MRLEITPAHELEWSRDLFGNSVATVDFIDRADRLRICSEVLLEQTASFPAHGTRPSTLVTFPVKFSGFEAAIAGAYMAPVFPDEFPEVRAWIGSLVDVQSVRGAEEALALVACAIRKAIKYRRREEKGVQTPITTLAEGSGSCRDMATLMLEALRGLGLPARFVSGYLDCVASEAGRASTHAWAEAYLPEIGWTGYDPTLGDATSEKHVVAGVSNHPRGVMPVSGTFFGDEKSYLGMEVIVQLERISVPKTIAHQP